MRTVSQLRGCPRWSGGVIIILMLGLVGMALTHSSAAFGVTNSSTATRVYEVGDNDFRISDMGPDGSMEYDAETPAIAYNSTNNEYLAVWSADDSIDGKRDIYGQRIDAATGAAIGENDFRISQMGGDDDQFSDTSAPDVVYNSTTNEYFVVWEAEIVQDGDLPPILGIYGQRLSAETGAAIGADDFRIDQDSADRSWYIPASPAVTYNSTNDEYLVVWQGNLAEDRSFEVVGQRLDSLGSVVGANEFLISDMGPDNDGDSALFTSRKPAVTYNVTDNEYFVVWSGDDDTAPLVDDEFEIFGQRLDATGTEVGANDFRISDIGPADDTAFAANTPTVTYNSTAGEYLVAWSGGFDTFDPDSIDYQIFVQRLSGAGAELGANDSQISDAGGNRIGYIAIDPAVVYNPANDEYLVTWAVDDALGGEVEDEQEIFGQRLNGTTGAEIGDNDFRISDMGPDEATDYNAFNPGVAYNSNGNGYLVVWNGDDDTTPLVDNEREVFGQRLSDQPEPTPTPTPTDPAATATPPSTTPTPTPGIPPVDSPRTFLPLIIR
ncbi:MAG: hypothetical protein GFH27_549291n69 [Chloroflexi bacterium AL-W]|nr:hypothetical protein [Chloroflexi bacterium AL-N1]NOK67464.1 hypothetical protein [Chloroflexi bacterium AL-N10]NOK75044.1 hypothetical protein [Chloroflexi bacterium AL-N5]NOK81831.1 hypothetical protein [Chloroflexi bacterium AL-W]NOK89677.1 hypothetical protein [Chloroflexi bacterium AL-N15]